MNMNGKYEVCFSTRKQSKKKKKGKTYLGERSGPNSPANLPTIFFVSIATGVSDRCLDPPREGKQVVRGLPWPSDQIPGAGDLLLSTGDRNVRGWSWEMHLS